MDTAPTGTPGPGLRHQAGTRITLRVTGGIALGVGIVLLVVGFARFGSGMDDPTGEGSGFGDLGMFAAGGFLCVLGFGLLSAGFVGTQARFAAGETMPVVKDSAHYLTDGQGLAGVGRTTSEQAASGPFCRQCGTRNDDAARFCDSCGQPLG